MKRQRTYENFEDFLQKQAAAHRMYPSDFLWQNIQQQMHGKTKWPALSVAALVVLALLTIGTLFIKPDETVLKTINGSFASLTKNSEADFTRQIATNNLTYKTIQQAKENAHPDVDPEQPVHEENTAPLAPNHSGFEKPIKKSEVQFDLLKSISVATVPERITLQEMPVIAAFYSRSTDDAVAMNRSMKHSLNTSAPDHLSTENLLLAQKSTPWQVQFYYARSATFRRLLDDKTRDLADNAAPLNASYHSDVNAMVRHKPSMGMEVGLSVGYRLNRSLTLKTGLQYNVRQYEMDAFLYNYEPASIQLMDNERMTTVSKFKNSTGAFPVTLSNKYSEVSVPVGIDWTSSFSSRLSWGIGASVQPTYVFSKSPQVLTSDFNHYADGSELLREFNINTSVETFITYKSGGLRWQIGPQFRYQQLPTYSNKYPVREFLFDYGIKVGVSRSIY